MLTAAPPFGVMVVVAAVIAVVVVATNQSNKPGKPGFFTGTNMKINLIVAMDRNGLIGINGRLPWEDHKYFKREDLAWFKQHTMGKVVLMGRKTYESIGKPLKGRSSIVLSSQELPDVCRIESLPNALEFASQYFDELFVIGGAQLYKETAPLASKLFLTTLRATIKVPPGAEAVYFPEPLANPIGACVEHHRTTYADYRILELCPPSTS